MRTGKQPPDAVGQLEACGLSVVEAGGETAHSRLALMQLLRLRHHKFAFCMLKCERRVELSHLSKEEASLFPS